MAKAVKAMSKKIGIVVVGADELENPQYRLIHDRFRCIAECLYWNLVFSMSFSAYEPGELMTQDSALDQLKEACAAITNQN